MAPTSVGIVSAAKALQDEGLCEEIKVSGLGVPAEMLEYTQNGCAPEFALVELRRPWLPDVLRLLPAGDWRDRGRGRRNGSWLAAWASTRSLRTRRGQMSTRCAC